MSRTYLVLILAMLAASGCNQATPSLSVAGSKIDGLPRPDSPQSAAGPKYLVARLKKGMAYADLRKVLMESGWKPVVDLQCKANVVGANYEELCKSDPSLDSCKICDHLPELSACSGDAYCGMHFSNNGERMHVVTYGSFEDWNVSGDQSQLSVSDWDFSKK